MDGKELVQGGHHTYYPPFWYGFAYTALATPFLVITVLVSIVIRGHDSYSKWTSYQILFYISICDLAQLIGHVFSGISLMLQWDMPNLLNIFLGSLMSGAWISSSLYGILLAVQRLFCIVFPPYDLKFYTGRCKTIIFTFAHLVTLSYIVLQWTNWSHHKFKREEFSWGYDYTLSLGVICYLMDDYSTVPFILCSFVCYSIIFYTLRTKSARKKMESAVTINVFIYCVFCAGTFILWRFVEPWLEPKPIAYFWTSLPWILYNGANAIICICFNRSTRENVIKLLHCRRLNEKRISVKILEKSQRGTKAS